MKSYFGDKAVLVTGASGFIGSWICAVMLELGAKVYGTVTRNSNPFSTYNLLNIPGRIEAIGVDIRDYKPIHDAFTTIKPDIIIHLAAVGSVPRSLADPLATFYINSFGTLNILECCRELNLTGKLLIASTDLAFGNDISNFPVSHGYDGYDEDKTVSFSGPYGTSKGVMELIARCYKYSFPDSMPSVSIVRCANVFGYGDVTERRVIPLFINSSIKKGSIQLKYRENGRQFLYITDAVRGYLKIITSLDKITLPTDTVSTFHLALEKYPPGPKPYISMIDLATLVANKLGSNVDLTDSIAFAPKECKIQALNCHKTRATINWEPRKSLSEGIDSTSEWYQILNSEKPGRLDLLKRLLKKAIEEITSKL